jgi:hypothetical protein
MECFSKPETRDASGNTKKRAIVQNLERRLRAYPMTPEEVKRNLVFCGAKSISLSYLDDELREYDERIKELVMDNNVLYLYIYKNKRALKENIIQINYQDAASWDELIDIIIVTAKMS